MATTGEIRRPPTGRISWPPSAQDEAKLGRAVRELREERGLTDRELADSIRGISLKGIRAIEAGECKALTYERMVRLACALGVELGALFRRSEGLSTD